MNPDVKLDLVEKGTRYDHYMELHEVFSTGIDIIDKMAPQYLSPSDRQLRVKLAGAVECIDKRLAKLADYSGKMQSWANLPRAMEEAARIGKEAGEKFKREQKLLGDGGKDGKQPQVSSVEGNSKDSQEPPDEPIGV